MRVVPVLSAAGTEDREARALQPINVDELSLYTAPQQNYNFTSPEPGQIEETVAAARRSVEPALLWFGVTYDRVRPRFQRGAQLVSDVYSFLRDPPKDFYAKAGVMGFSGLVGLLAARGSRLKRLLYPTGLVTLSASLYYPESAVRIATATGDKVYTGAVQGYAAVERMLKPKTQEKPQEELTEKPTQTQADSPNTP